MEGLTDPKVMSARQAVEALGGGVHVGVARQLVRDLMQRGWLAPGMTYGSAYSGVDTVAAAVEAETEGNFCYPPTRFDKL